MNRQQYKQARRLIRDNGRFALRWVPAAMAAVCDAADAQDAFAERADILASFAREGVACTPVHTAVFPEILARWNAARMAREATRNAA